MQGRDIIVIGASAGGVEALTALVRTLPSDLPAALFVVLHIPAQSSSLLPEILSRVGVLPAIQAKDELDIYYGHIYVAPPDHHLLLERGRMCVVHGSKRMNSSRSLYMMPILAYCCSPARVTLMW
jgi:two-component system chemotaxis response regulator CheB